MIKKWKAISASVLFLGLGAAITGSSVGETAIDRPSDIVPSLAAKQLPSDKLPDPAAKDFSPTGINLASTRWLGDSETLSYFAVPMGGEKICMITVGQGGNGLMMACTHIEDFGEAGLRVENADDSEEAWLLANDEMANSVRSGNNEAGKSEWIKESPNFLVKSHSSNK